MPTFQHDDSEISTAYASLQTNAAAPSVSQASTHDGASGGTSECAYGGGGWGNDACGDEGWGSCNWGGRGGRRGCRTGETENAMGLTFDEGGGEKDDDEKDFEGCEKGGVG